MNPRFVMIVPALSVALILVSVSTGRCQDEGPFQVRAPRDFWLGKQVFQKRGIVVEDDDYIVRERYWILDAAVSGQVVDVEELSGGTVAIDVEFQGMGAGWQERGINIRDRVFRKSNRNVRIRPNPYGDGAQVDTDEVSFSYRIEGEQVDPDRCGRVIRHEGPAIVVRFPSYLLALVSPRKGDLVARSWDWHDGFADGGAVPKGRHQGSSGECVGVVVNERDEDGFIDVKWQKTGRTKSHRFDHLGYYDVERVH